MIPVVQAANATDLWRWGLLPGAELVHVVGANGRTLCGRRTLGDGVAATKGDGSDCNRCGVCARRARWMR